MFDLIRANQLNVMLFLCGACGILILLLVNTRFLSPSRKAILILMESVALLLLWFDRLAYVYAGVTGQKAYIMVRVSNFMVFFLTSFVVFGVNLYLTDLLKNEGKVEVLPKRLIVVRAASSIGMAMAIIAAFTGLYYYFDESNQYHRGQGFLIAYIIPVLCPILQYTIVRQYKKSFSRLIYISLVLYLFIPTACGILQIFTYGISIVNMSMVAVSICLYIFMYLDLNNTVNHAHEIEIQNMQGEHAKMRRLFDQTATAFVSAVEKKDDYLKGNALRIAEYAEKIAKLAGKSEEDCEKVYYAALLHDVGLIGIPDQVIKNDTDPDQRDREEMHKKPIIGEEILSSITEYPYLREGAHYSHERYNGTGYPEGLKGEEIPEIARIIAVADAYVTMTTKKRYRDAHPNFEAREAIVREAGESFDPVFAELMVKIIDSEGREGADHRGELEKEITCREYRENVSAGIEVESDIVRISFDCGMPLDPGHPFAAPSIVLFDAFDGRVHDSRRSIENYHYLEYGEIWFDKYSITTEARKIEERMAADTGVIMAESGGERLAANRYEILAGRYEDHIKLIMRSANVTKEVIVALPGGSRAAYIGLTGENVRLMNIKAEPSGKSVAAGDIPRIVESVSYIDRFESDIPNVQVDRCRSACTQGIELGHKLTVAFHTMTLPGANLVWHCPYVLLYSSDDGRVDGDNYREYALVKLNGEIEATEEYAHNNFRMLRQDSFPGWEQWKSIHLKGLDCEVHFETRGNHITLKTENLGISIENTTTLNEEGARVFAALTGDQVALTDIRLLNGA